jgi:hypothetical protein
MKGIAAAQRRRDHWYRKSYQSEGIVVDTLFGKTQIYIASANKECCKKKQDIGCERNGKAFRATSRSLRSVKYMKF